MGATGRSRQSYLPCVFAALVALACGGKSRADGAATGSGAGNTGSAGSAAGAGSAGRSGSADGSSSAGTAACPDTEPTEGAPCAPVGLRCPGSGSLSCPETAICTSGKWQINCPAMMLGGGACGCAHHDFGRVPEEHRPAPVACSPQRAPSISTPDGGCISLDGGAPCPGSGCSQDSECTAGENGRCMQMGPLPGYRCNYDECVADSDCGKGSVCQCRAPLDGVAPNYCTQASSCKTDADCGTGGYCSPTQAHEWCRSFYACHTAQDECVNDSDCPENVPCDFVASLQHWACSNGCGPVPP